MHRMLAVPAPVSRNIQLQGVKVLFVADDNDARASTEAALGRVGAEVVTATTVEHALELLRTCRPDVMVSDIGSNGYQLIRMVRSRTPLEGSCTPAIAVTGHTGNEEHAKALLAGYQVQLGKPLAIGELLAAIHDLVGRSRVHRS